MASEHASGSRLEDQDITRLISNLECDVIVQTGVLKQFAKILDAAKALAQEKAKTTQEVERLREELSNQNTEMENLRSMIHELSVKVETLSRDEPKEELFDQYLTDRMIAEDSQRREELSEIRKTLVKVFDDIVHCRQNIRLKMMGEVNCKPFIDAALNEHPRDIAKDEAAKNCAAWQQKIADPAWHPYKMITEDGSIKRILNDENETLKELKASGQDIYDAVTEALKDMDEYNPSGRSVVAELWNYKQGRKATILECIEYLHKKVKDQSEKKRKNNMSSI